MSIKINWDFLGIATSVACAIHCAVLPVVLSALPLFGINIIHNATFEWGMIALAFFVGCYSLMHGYIRHHQNFLSILLFSIGFMFLILKQIFPFLEYYFLAMALLLIVSAHFINYRYCQQSKLADSSDNHH